MKLPETKEQWIQSFKQMWLSQSVWTEPEMKHMWFSEEEIQKAKDAFLKYDAIKIYCTKNLVTK